MSRWSARGKACGFFGSIVPKIHMIHRQLLLQTDHWPVKRARRMTRETVPAGCASPTEPDTPIRRSVMEEQGNEDSPRRRGRSRYPKEFRRDAAALVIDQRRTVPDVARQLGVVEQTLGNWVRQERIDRGEREGLSSEDRARISELERQVKRLTSERDLLKRSVAFWVKESDR